MSKRRIARRQIAAAHLQSTDRGARLLAACNGDVEHAQRVAGELERYSCNVDESAGLAPVISLPRPYDHALEEELELEAVVNVLGWWPAALLGLASWIALAAIAFGAYSLVEAFT